MKRKNAFLYLFSFIALLGSCKDPYLSPYKPLPTGYLVVEGYISGNSTTQFSLTRSIELPGDSALPVENAAQVQVEGSDNSAYALQALGNGVYSSVDTLPLNPAIQYRLRIQTADGEGYLSDFVPYKVTPAIDSINYITNGDGTEIYANAHDPSNNTRYYQWNYDQTYEYHSAEQSLYYYDEDTVPPAVVPRPLGDQVYRCWTSGSSSTIILNSTAKLAQDVVYLQPLKNIPVFDVQTSVLYSIRVRQYALTEDGYNFLSLMQKNSESLGSIFDAQPSQINGNIHSMTHPAEQVIGYISAGTVEQQRIFISRYQVNSTYSYSCPVPDTALPLDAKSLKKNFSGGGPYTPIELVQLSTGISAWLANGPECLVCTLHGGTNVKPSFWPN
jgi:hypothetical protein